MDIGGTKILGVAFDGKGREVARIKRRTKAEKGLTMIEETIVGVVEGLLKSGGLKAGEIAAISAGAPGVIDTESGVILYSPNLPWRDYRIREIIEGRYGVPFHIGNDANVGVMGEWKYGAGKGHDDVVSLFWGTGIGGGVILGGKPFAGARYAGTELGHMTLNPDGPYCNCGQRGCLEAYSSKIAISREIKANLDRGRKSLLKDAMDEDSIFRSKALRQALDEKDELAHEVVAGAARFMGVAAGSLINIFNPDVFILGGGVMESIAKYVMPEFMRSVRRYSWPEALAGTKIAEAELGDEAIIYGALAMAGDVGDP